MFSDFFQKIKHITFFIKIDIVSFKVISIDVRSKGEGGEFLEGGGEIPTFQSQLKLVSP